MFLAERDLMQRLHMLTKLLEKMKTKERKPKVDYFCVQIYTDSCYPDVARDGWMALH